MATRYSGDVTVTCSYHGPPAEWFGDSRGSYACKVAPAGKRGKTVSVEVHRSLEGGSPEAYDSAAALAISEAEVRGLYGNPELERNPSRGLGYRTYVIHRKKPISTAGGGGAATRKVASRKTPSRSVKRVGSSRR